MTGPERLYQLSEIADQHHIDKGMSFSLAFQAVLKGEVLALWEQNQQLREAAQEAVSFIENIGSGDESSLIMLRAILAATGPPEQEGA